MAESHTDKVKSFFSLTRGVKDPARVRLLGGEDVVSVSTIRRWKAELKKGDVRPLTEPVETALDAYLLRKQLGKGDPESARAVIRAMRDRLDELEDELPAVDPKRIHGLADSVADAQKPKPQSPPDVEKQA